MVTAADVAAVTAPVGLVESVRQVLASAPEHLRDELVRQTLEGRDAARRGEVAVVEDEVPPSELIERQRAVNRLAALKRAVPVDRAQVAARGLAGLDGDQHAQELRGWLLNPLELTLILAGSTGSGKTMAAYCAATHATLEGAAMRDRRDREKVRPLFVRAWTVSGYLAELRPDGSPEPVWQIRNWARNAELLILDDLGAEVDGAGTEFVRRELVELIDYRLDARLRTIITTNLHSRRPRPDAPAGLLETFGERLFSRLTDRATALRFVGPDRRKLRPLEW